MNMNDLNLKDMIEKARKLQSELESAQAQKEQWEIHGESAAGLVKTVMTGKYDVKKLKIDPSLLEEDIETIEDVIASAINNSVAKVEYKINQEMGDLIKLPPGVKFPF